jgi:Domain of Unknown Function (DUF1521)
MSVTNNFNFNFNNFSLNDSLPSQNIGLPKIDLGGAFDQISSILDKLSSMFEQLGSSNQGFASGDGGCCCPGKPAPIEPPNFDDCHHPKNSLKTEGNVITTPGGYKIEQQGQFNWKITGPDGKETKIWGDPHVAEGDGGTWDFKKDSIFKLPDNTEIKVNCVPYGNGMTVTGSLDIICGSDHIKVSDIDKGMGKIGENQGNGILQQFGNDISGLDHFVMGKESDDWSLGGKEIIGSNNGGDSFKLGNDLAAGKMPQKLETFSDMLRDLMNKLTGGSWGNSRGFNDDWHPYRKPVQRDETTGRTDQVLDSNQFRNNGRQDINRGVRHGIRNLQKMVKLLTRLSDLTDRMNGFRNRGFYA